MRVANKVIYDMVKYQLGNITEQMTQVNRTVATGKRINNLADDPVALSQALKAKSSLSNLKQLGRNLNMGKMWLSASESAMTNVQGLISEAKGLCVQMATSTTSAAERSSAAQTVHNIFAEIISLANTEINGSYIFSGSKTDTVPFLQDGTYQGDNKGFAVKIGQDATVEVGKDGQSIFQPPGSDLFQILTDLKTDLQGNDIDGIQAAMDRLQTHFDHMSSQISDVGSKSLRMEIKERIFQDLELANTERLSKIEDADIAEAITDLKSLEVAYQAALASSSRIMSMSLVDYLK
jgi:flagellar hook-associated protein 3 FlgL